MNLTSDAMQAIGAALLLAVAGGWIVFSVYLLRWYLEDHVR